MKPAPNAGDTLRDWLAGWRHGAGIMAIPQGTLSPEWNTGWKAGRDAFRAAAEKKRKALRLPPGAIVTATGSTPGEAP